MVGTSNESVSVSSWPSQVRPTPASCGKAVRGPWIWKLIGHSVAAACGAGSLWYTWQAGNSLFGLKCLKIMVMDHWRTKLDVFQLANPYRNGCPLVNIRKVIMKRSTMLFMGKLSVSMVTVCRYALWVIVGKIMDDIEGISWCSKQSQSVIEISWGFHALYLLAD